MSSSPTNAAGPNLRHLARNAYGRLLLVDRHGQTHENVTPVRAHPLSAPDEGIAFVGTDGHELAWIDHIDQLPEDQRTLLREEFAGRELMPTVRQLISVSTFSTPSEWTVETDRGPTRFILKSEEDIRRLGEGRLLIASSHGLPFMVPDRFALDRASRRLLERFL
ncbi:DUF1854 domain-containing protein [Roseateles amylovorans]|uniref:DUF1854 domain-containing protein n=1 Tax=Roseateles amylovorans TaxID=2978473 RepID=A0ABY6B220_9BURK|nr:DUF1854 domain-containing protein [Roseateles amylovorans]UXH79258.1 DUF1854 domain-containing protein [Roseateles amylovorans]